MERIKTNFMAYKTNGLGFLLRKELFITQKLKLFTTEVQMTWRQEKDNSK